MQDRSSPTAAMVQDTPSRFLLLPGARGAQARCPGSFISVSESTASKCGLAWPKPRRFEPIPAEHPHRFYPNSSTRETSDRLSRLRVMSLARQAHCISAARV